MHILLIHQAFAALDEPGGTRHHEFALHLAEAGHRVTVIASPVSYLTGKNDPAKKQTSADGRVTILRAYTYSALHKSFVHRVLAFLSFMWSSFWIGLRVRDVDLVWGTSPPIFQGITAWLLARLKRASFLFEIRDLWPAFAVAVGVLTNPLLIGLSEWLERFLYKRADRLMINSPGFRDHVQARGAREVSLVPNGADAAMFDPTDDGADFRTQNQLGRSFVALYAGAHGMSNDLDVVLDAAAQLTDLPECLIVFLGDGKEKSRLTAQADSLGLNNVRFLPPVPKTEMGAALAASDACIAILKPVEMYKTVYPNKVFDYMAAGRPTLLAIDGVIREVVTAAEAGINIQPGDSQALAAGIRTLFDDRESAREMGLHGRAYIEKHFDRGLLADKLVGIIESLSNRT
jgi:glycosyltransferase involved in cell wall biosynthesis